MITFKQLNELFKAEPHGGKEDTNDAGDMFLTKKIGGRDITLTARRSGRTWEIVFHEYDPEKGTTSYDATGSGDEFEVFKFIMNGIRHFVEKKNPQRIQFSAVIADDNRVKLYRRMMQRFAKDNWLKSEYELTNLGPTWNGRAMFPPKKELQFDLLKLKDE